MGEEIAEELSKRIMIFDGAMGTMLQRRHLEEKDFRGEGLRRFTVNSGEHRISYSVLVCVMGNLWLVKFNGFILQPMA